MPRDSLTIEVAHGHAWHVTPTNRGYVHVDVGSHWPSVAEARRLAHAILRAADYTENDTPGPHQAALARPAALSDPDGGRPGVPNELKPGDYDHED